MTSQGFAHGRFQRAIGRGAVDQAEIADSVPAGVSWRIAASKHACKTRRCFARVEGESPSLRNAALKRAMSSGRIIPHTLRAKCPLRVVDRRPVEQTTNNNVVYQQFLYGPSWNRTNDLGI